MDIVLLVGVPVVMPMHRRPPQRAALHGGIAEHGKSELHRARGVESAVRKVAVVKAGDGKHPHEIKRRGDGDRRPAPADREHRETADVQEDKRQAAPPFKAVGPRAHRLRALGEVVGVEPLPNGGEDAGERVAGRGHGGGWGSDHGQ